VLRDSKIIITCAVTGNAPFNNKHPSFPVTPVEIANACIEAANAGAAIVHIHVRDLDTRLGCTDPEMFKEVVDRIRDANSSVLINLTGGGGAFLRPDPLDEARGLPDSDIMTVDQRMEHLELCRPDIASLDINTSNQMEGAQEFVYLNTTRTLRAMARRYQAAGIKPELEVFSAGDIEFGKELIREGLIDGNAMFQYVLGVKWQIPTDTLGMYYLTQLLPDNANWGALGIGKYQMPVVAQTALMGGNVRVGLEDNLYLDRGVFATNGKLVERARSIVEQLGYEVADVSSARSILGIL